MRYTCLSSLPATTIIISSPSPRTFLVAAATDALAPFLIAEANGILVHLALFMLPTTSWRRFSLLCPSYDSVWILVKCGCSKQGSGAMSRLVLYDYHKDTEELSPKEMRLKRFTKEIRREHECEMFPDELSSFQLGEVTDESSNSRRTSQKT